MKFGPLHEETLPILTAEEKRNTEFVFYCIMHNGCLFIAHTYEKDGIRKCRRHGCEVKNITNSVLARSFREMVGSRPME